MRALSVDRVRTSDAGVGDVVRFLAAHPAATGYALPAWLDVMEHHEEVRSSYQVAREAHGAIVGVMPIAERPLHRLTRALPMTRRDSLPFTCFGGPLVAPELDEREAARVAAALLGAGGPVLETVFYPGWRAPPWLHRCLTTELGFSVVSTFEVAVKELAGLTERGLTERGLTERELLASYHKQHSRAVTAAERRGVVVREAKGTADYLEFFDMYDETMRAAGEAPQVSKDFVVRGGQRLAQEGIAQLLLAWVDGAPAAGVFFVYGGGTACFWLGATAKDERSLRHRPMHATLHKSFVQAVARGARAVELGGLVNEGLRQFKTLWGARAFDQPLYERSRFGFAPRVRAAREALARRVRPPRP